MFVSNEVPRGQPQTLEGALLRGAPPQVRQHGRHPAQRAAGFKGDGDEGRAARRLMKQISKVLPTDLPSLYTILKSGNPVIP